MNGFLMFLVWRREKRSQNTCYTGRRKQRGRDKVGAQRAISVLDAPNYVYELDVGLIGVSHCTS